MGVAAELCLGHVMHLRLIPRRHRFRYRALSLLVDLDRLGEMPASLMKVNRRGFVSFHEADHGPRDGTSLRDWANHQLATAQQPPASRILLHAIPRVLGYTFNPLSVYFCYGPDGCLQSLIYQVKNTFGDQIAYVHAAGDARDGRFRQTQRKEMYVSPFIGMDQVYRFTLLDPLSAPAHRLAVRIRQSGPEGETLIATHTSETVPLTNRSLVRALLSYPGYTFAVMALIHMHALRLWLKGIRWHSYRADAAFRSMKKE